MDFIQYILSHTSTFLFVFIRTGAILMLVPVFSAMYVPMKVKIGLSLIISMILVPVIGYVPMPQTMFELILSIMRECLIGFIIGLAVRFIFTGAELAGQIIGFQMGLGMANVVDPINSVQITVLGKLMSIMTMLVFLSINGHLMVIMALDRSFELLPPYGLRMSGTLTEGVISLSRDIFILGVKLAAPVIATLIFANLTIGILARIVPQLNMFVIGFAVTIIAGLVTIAFSMPFFEAKMRVVIEDTWFKIFDLMRVM